MAKGMCYRHQCGRIFDLEVRGRTPCPACGAYNLPISAAGRYDRIPAGPKLPTPDPKMAAIPEQAPASKPTADASKEGRKIGKVRMDLVMQDMPRAIEGLARVMTWALEEKGYKESDWLTVPDGIRKYHGGLHRHDNKEMRGQTCDDESNLHHAYHTAWNAMARLELILRDEEERNAAIPI